MSHPGQFEIGETVAERFRVLSVLGAGGSGAVYEVEELSQGANREKRLALKVIHKNLVRDPQVSRRFDREARILAKLRGPNLVPLWDYGRCMDGRPFMVLDLVPGKPLDTLIGAQAFAEPEAVDITSGVCRALETAHEAGVIHRDLKPGNILVSRDDSRLRTWVLDFGMAKVLRGDLTDSVNALTEQNMVFGTPAYMAPEQARGDVADERADIYAVGILLYELLTGTVPFEERTAIATMTAHLTTEPPPPSSQRDSAVSPAVEAVILHALAKSPEDRYATASDLALALELAIAEPDHLDQLAPAQVAARSVRKLPVGPPHGEPLPIAESDEAPTSDDLGSRDTELELEAALQRTLPAAPPVDVSRLAPAPEAPISRTWIVVGVLAAVLGIAMGIVMSLGNG